MKPVSGMVLVVLVVLVVLTGMGRALAAQTSDPVQVALALGLGGMILRTRRLVR